MDMIGNRRLPALGKSLSAKLLLLTILFVMVAEVLIFNKMALKRKKSADPYSRIAPDY